MSGPGVNLFVARCECGACIRVVGRANFTCSVDFKTLLNGLLADGCADFVFDLSQCLLMDSTFLGVLAGTVLRLSREGAGRDGHVFQIVEAPPSLAASAQAVPVPVDAHSKSEVTRTCLEAHQLLMSLSPANEAKFKDVARFFAEDLKKMDQGKAA